MSIRVLDIVTSTCGNNKGKSFVVVDVCGEYAFICDGKRRKITNPKKKKKKHLILSGRCKEEIDFSKIGVVSLNKMIKRELRNSFSTEKEC